MKITKCLHIIENMLLFYCIANVFKRGELMAVKREWTKLEKQNLLEHISESKKRGITIKDAALEFSRRNPHITPSQARVYYYKLINETENFRKKYSQKIWTDEENEFLLDFMEQYKNRRKIEIFNILSERLNRHPKAIASHYYSIKNNPCKFNLKHYYIDLFNNFKGIQIKSLFSKISKIQEVYEKAIEIESILRREKIIAELNKELDEARIKIKMLEQKIMVS